MNKKVKLFIVIIIILDIIFLVQWIINKNLSNNVIVSSTNSEKNINNIIKLEYGDTIKEHKLIDVDSNEINITKLNKQYKFIKLVRLSNNLNVIIKDLTNLDSLKNEYRYSVLFVYLTVGEIDLKNKKVLVKLINKYEIPIVNMLEEDAIKQYNISEIRCGLNILLDSDNRIRFVYPDNDLSLLKQVIKNELGIRKIK
jgi:hypothetical protein